MPIKPMMTSSDEGADTKKFKQLVNNSISPPLSARISNFGDAFSHKSSKSQYDGTFSPRLSNQVRRSVFMNSNDPMIEESKYGCKWLQIELLKLKEAITQEIFEKLERMQTETGMVSTSAYKV